MGTATSRLILFRWTSWSKRWPSWLRTRFRWGNYSASRSGAANNSHAFQHDRAAYRRQGSAPNAAGFAGGVFPDAPVGSRITGLPHSAVPYFFLKQTYDTAIATQLLEPHGVSCPAFESYAATIVDYAAGHPILPQFSFFSVPPRCSLCLCGAKCSAILTTETQRTQRGHRGFRCGPIPVCPHLTINLFRISLNLLIMARRYFIGCARSASKPSKSLSHFIKRGQSKINKHAFVVACV